MTTQRHSSARPPSPAKGDKSRIASIEAQLQQRVRNENAKAILAFASGVPLCFLAPLILGSALWMSAHFGLSRWTPWWWWFGGVALLGIPSLFRLELRTSGGYLDQAVREGDMLGGPLLPPLSAGNANAYAIGMIASVAMQPTLSAAGFVEVFLSGPRLVLYGLRRFRQRRTDREVDVHRAAEVVGSMLSVGSGVEPKSLLRPAERMPDLVPVLMWLAANRWIGVTESGDRVYLFTDARTQLEALR